MGNVFFAVSSTVSAGLAAGIMVYISIDEPLPTFKKYGRAHQEIYGFIAGMGVMAVSLALF